jgi:heat shock protein HslJ
MTTKTHKKSILFFIIFLSTSIFLFSSCKSNKKTADLTDDQKLARVWMMTEMDVNQTNNFTKDDFIKAKAELNLTTLKDITTDLEGKRIAQGSAFMGCNNIFFTISTKGKSDRKKNITFSEAGMTRKACQENMELEAIFGKNLSEMTNYKLEGQFLTLSSEDGKRMKFVAQDWD